jgi:hypothetical protein
MDHELSHESLKRRLKCQIQNVNIPVRGNANAEPILKLPWLLYLIAPTAKNRSYRIGFARSAGFIRVNL